MRRVTELNLLWPVSVSGYELVRAVVDGREDLLIVPKSVGTTPQYDMQLKDLGQLPWVYREFVSTPPYPADILKFTRKYGALVRYALADAAIGKLNLIDAVVVSEWVKHQETFRQFVETKPAKRVPFHSLETTTSLHPAIDRAAECGAEERPRTYEYVTAPKSLLGILELQAMQIGWSSLLEYKYCSCGRPFLIGKGHRRSDSKYCSDDCQDNYSNEKKRRRRNTGKRMIDKGPIALTDDRTRPDAAWMLLYGLRC
jgi:hypothetical protein